MKRLLLLSLWLVIPLTQSASAKERPQDSYSDKETLDSKQILYFQRGCFLKYLDGDYSESIKYCTKAINYVPPSYHNKIGISFEARGLSRKALGDDKGACEDWGKAIEVGYSPMPSYWSAFSKAFHKKKLTMGHAQAMEQTEKAVPYGKYDKDYEVKQIKSFCELVQQ